MCFTNDENILKINALAISLYDFVLTRTCNQFFLILYILDILIHTPLPPAPNRCLPPPANVKEEEKLSFILKARARSPSSTL